MTLSAQLLTLLLLVLERAVAERVAPHVVFQQASVLPARDWTAKSEMIQEEFEGGRIFVAQFAPGMRSQLRKKQKTKQKKRENDFFFFFFFFFFFTSHKTFLIATNCGVSFGSYMPHDAYKVFATFTQLQCLVATDERHPLSWNQRSKMIPSLRDNSYIFFFFLFFSFRFRYIAIQ
jgi:hypothetical protein